MLQAHSFLWHYLWLAPHILQLVLAAWIIRRGMYKLFPIFLAYLLFEATEEFVLYAMDVLPSVSWQTFWRTFCVGLVIEGLLRVLLVGELFSHLVRSWPSVAKFGNRLVSGTGVVLVLIASVAAAYAPIDNPEHPIIPRAHVLEQSFYIIESGLVLFLFLFAAYFRLRPNNLTFGIGLGRGISASVHLATWAVMANGGLADKRYLLDFVNTAIYHVCVLIWFYYFLIPEKRPAPEAVPLPEHNLALWNRELERLLQQ
jgi:hypothetical protein